MVAKESAERTQDSSWRTHQLENSPKIPGCWRRVAVDASERSVNDNDFMLLGSAHGVPWELT